MNLWTCLSHHTKESRGDVTPITFLLLYLPSFSCYEPPGVLVGNKMLSAITKPAEQEVSKSLYAIGKVSKPACINISCCKKTIWVIFKNRLPLTLEVTSIRWLSGELVNRLVAFAGSWVHMPWARETVKGSNLLLTLA